MEIHCPHVVLKERIIQTTEQQIIDDLKRLWIHVREIKEEKNTIPQETTHSKFDIIDI